METKWCWAFPAHSRPPKPIGLSRAQQSPALPPSGRTCTPAQCAGWMRQGWAHIQHSLVIWQVLVEKQMEKAEDTQFPKFLFRRLYPPQPPLNLWVSSDSLNPSSKFLPLGAQEKRASICENYRSWSVVVLGCVCVPVKCWLLAGKLGVEVSFFLGTSYWRQAPCKKSQCSLWPWSLSPLQFWLHIGHSELGTWRQYWLHEAVLRMKWSVAASDMLDTKLSGDLGNGRACGFPALPGLSLQWLPRVVWKLSWHLGDGY